MAELSDKQRLWIEEYLICWNATQAAQRVYQSSSRMVAGKTGSENLHNPKIRAIIEERMAERAMSANEVLARLAEHARADLGDFLTPTGRGTRIDIKKAIESGKGHLLKKYSTGKRGTSIEIVDQQGALALLGRRWRLIGGDGDQKRETEGKKLILPADVIASPFIKAYRDIRDHRHTEYLFYGGRGSTKSSFVSLVMIYLLINNPTMHALAARQIANTLRDSVYSQLIWAINELGLTDDFNCTASPLEIEYKPTGQTIYFRGADKPEAIKSIKPPFGYIGLLWLEELDQFHGEEAIRKIEQSVIRGGDLAFIFKSFNPPRTANNWANRYAKIPKNSQYQHASNYLDVPPEWLGKVFLEEAEHLKAVNPMAYEHEYMGVANGMGAQVFGNVVIRKITDREIYGAVNELGEREGGFDRILHGLDFGFYPDPAHYSRVHYDAARMTLYIYGEVRRWKTGNRDMYNALVDYGLQADDLLIADSAEPKSVADFRDYGATCRGAEKGPESVKYSMKWLQSLAAIVIDNERCPYAAGEFMNYEYDCTRDGEIIEGYPDHDNHGIDSVRYGTNAIWKRRGQ